MCYKMTTLYEEVTEAEDRYIPEINVGCLKGMDESHFRPFLGGFQKQWS